MKTFLVKLLILFFFSLFLLTPGIHAQTSGADLVITDFVLTDASGRVKSNFAVNEPIYVKVTFRNQGNQVTPATGDSRIYHTYYRHRTSGITSCAVASDPRNFYSYSTTNFAAGSSYVYESRPGGIKEAQFPGVKSFTQTTPGSYQAWAYADYDCRVTETNNNNNQRSIAYTVGSPAVPSATPTVVAGPVVTQPPTTTATPIPNPTATWLTPIPGSQPVTTNPPPQEGSWYIDAEVTRIGKNASRSGMLLDWTLRDYEWSFVEGNKVNPLIPFWQIIQRIVYALFLFVIMVTAFILIITRGRSLSAKRFLPRFFFVILLVTFSFSLIQFLYQIIDLIQGFFLKNPKGEIISSRDLLFVGFDYRTFQGLRAYGQLYEESAFISLLLTQITAFTYYVMSMLLIFRKILLWFFIIISPVFPILLLFYPVRNTAKIWIGEFFRWLLYGPLFAIFLSGLVKLWSTSLPLLFNFQDVNNASRVIYPTAVNILLGGPGQIVRLNNSVNLPDTFALYVVALIMLWAVIIMPFILLQIFLDYMMAFNYRDNPSIKQMMGIINNRFAPSHPPIIPPPGSPSPAGHSRALPFARRFEIPKGAGMAKALPRPAGEAKTLGLEKPLTARMSKASEISKLTNLSVPTMRDIAQYEKSVLSQNVIEREQFRKTNTILSNIANPNQITNQLEKERFHELRSRLVRESQKGNNVATSILNAATIYNMYSSQSTSTVSSQNFQQLVQNLSNPERVTNTIEREKIEKVKEQLTTAAQAGNQFATSVLNSISTINKSTVTHLSQVMQQIAKPEQVTNTTERQSYEKLREKIVEASKSGNNLATLMMQSFEKATSVEEVKVLHDQLLKAEAEGSPIATEVLKTVKSATKLDTQEVETLKTKLREAKQKGEPLAASLLSLLEAQDVKSSVVPAEAKLKTGAFPAVNRIQQVSLDDYEAVKKMWHENYQNLEVPEGLSGVKTRKDWISSDIADIEETIGLLTSTNPADVEEGMKKVSDILPFLLIGGFSQTEIVAYLKAKLEAGKSVLEEVEKEAAEEDTLVAATVTPTVAKQHMTMAREASFDEPTAPVSASTTINETTNNYTTITMPATADEDTSEQQTESGSSGLLVSQVQRAKLLELTNLSLPTMKDIVRYEQMTRAKDAEKKKEVEQIKTTLSRLAHPESLSPSEKERFVQMRDVLEKESKEGNPLAQMVLNAATTSSASEPSFTAADVPVFLAAIETVIDPSTITDESAKKEYAAVSAQVAQAREQADPLALQLIKVGDDSRKATTEKTKEILKQLKNHDGITSEPEKTTYSKLSERLTADREQGNQLATKLLEYAAKDVSEDEVKNIHTTLLEAAQSGDPLANYITTTLLAPPQQLQDQAMNVYRGLVQQKDKQNSFAPSLLQLLKKKVKKTGGNSGLITALPEENRIQQVSLEDYETVKKMWYENYLHGDPPPDSTGKQLDRLEWIKQDSTTISATINLLSSPNVAEKEEGMEHVSDILPFLLIGGFSQTEIISYLKAKLEAAKSAQDKLSGQDDESLVERSEQQTKAGQESGRQMAAEIPQDSGLQKHNPPAVHVSENPEKASEIAPIVPAGLDNGSVGPKEQNQQ